MDVAKLPADIAQWWASLTWNQAFWLAFGFAAQLMFAGRFVVQIIASERVKRSVVPEMFWYFSFAGGLGLLMYAIHKVDPVFILGQGMGLAIYARNIYFIRAAKNGDVSKPELTAAE